MFPDSTGELLGELEISSGATAADFSARLSLKVSSLHSNASGGRAGCQVTASLKLRSLNVSRWVCFNVIPVLLLGFNFMSFNFLFYVLISIIVKQFYCLCKLSVRERLINKSENYGMHRGVHRSSLKDSRI